MNATAGARATSARIDGSCLVVELAPDTAPLWADRLYISVAAIPALAAATGSQRRAIEIIAGGCSLRWPMIDEDLSVAGLVRGDLGGRRET